MKEEALSRLREWEELYVKVKDRTTQPYLEMLNGMRMDYELVGDTEACPPLCDEIINLCATNEIIDENYRAQSMLAALDTKARMGDFRSYCMALEWNRPIEKQFFLPRKRVLEKHGLIQSMQDMADDKLDFLFVSLPPRIGKNLSHDTPILTKKGWKRHGDLQVGDYVLNEKGRFVKVLAISDEMPINCEVTFSNGEKIQCHENHEWVVYDVNKRKTKLYETKYLKDNVLVYHSEDSKGHGSKYRFLLPYTEPVIGIQKDLPVHPYTLGVWLGNGCNKAPHISEYVKDAPVMESVCKEYTRKWDYIDNRNNCVTMCFPQLRQDLQKTNMCYSTRRCTKHIPDDYFTASLQQRLELLAGLLDTDGYCNKKERNYQYVSVDKELIDDVCKLISTFGWRPCVRRQEPHVSSSGIIGRKPVYTVKFRPTFEIPCRLERKQLREFSIQRKITITDIKKLENPTKGKCIQVEGGIYLAGKTLIPTHNSTLGLFFLTFMAGLHPDRSILGNGHSASLTQSFYEEILNIICSEEYRFFQIFPNCKLVNKSAEYSYLDLNSQKRFHTIMFRSIDGGTTGVAEASNVLYCDDLIKDVEQANNPDRLQKLFETYTSTVQDRKVQRLCKDGVYRPCPEIHIATRWSTHDVIGRLIDIYGEVDSERIRIINVPCYDENGESNFIYDYGKGFNKEYYQHLQLSEDPVIFAAKYLGEPVERDGLVFTKDTISFYNELPDGEPDRIVAYADVSHGGEDYFSLPVGYVYGNEVYIEDILFENKFGGDDYIRPRVCNIIMRHKVQRFGIEKNNGGDFFSTLITNDLRKLGYRCNITTHNAPTNKSKRDRILACQNEIKGIAGEENTYRLYFKSDEARKGNEMYSKAMNQLYNWNQNSNKQKTQHDDMPDSLAGLITNVLGGTKGRAKSIDASRYL